MFSVDFIYKETNMSHSELSDFLSAGIKNYKVHTQKTKGKVRTVYQPSEILQKLQAIVVREVLSKYPVSPHSMAYEKGCSILKNAQVHKNSKFLARYDIKDFFGSIKFWHFERLLSDKYGYSDVKLFWRICSLNDALPVGAYSSSFIANRIMHNFDKDIARKIKSVNYTRYADDLVFSSDSPLPDTLKSELVNSLRDIRFALNEKKTRNYNQKTPKRVTGITVTPSNNLTVGKRYKLAIKKQLYDYITKSKGNKKKIIGRLNYIKFIEPSYYNKLVEKYNLTNNLLFSDNNFSSDNRTRPTFSIDSNFSGNKSRTYSSKTSTYKKSNRVSCFILITALAIIIGSSIIGYLYSKKREKDSTGESPQIIEFTDQNYTDHLQFYWGYANYITQFTLSLNIMNTSDYWIEDLTFDIKILYKGEIVATKTVNIDLLAKLPERLYYEMDKAYSTFSSYEFEYSSFSGTVTDQPLNMAYVKK